LTVISPRNFAVGGRRRGASRSCDDGGSPPPLRASVPTGAGDEVAGRHERRHRLLDVGSRSAGRGFREDADQHAARVRGSERRRPCSAPSARAPSRTSAPGGERDGARRSSRDSERFTLSTSAACSSIEEVAMGRSRCRLHGAERRSRDAPRWTVSIAADTTGDAELDGGASAGCASTRRSAGTARFGRHEQDVVERQSFLGELPVQVEQNAAARLDGNQRSRGR